MKEVDKWAKIHDDVVVLHQFFEFLSSKHLHLCEVNKSDDFLPSLKTHDDLIYEYFKINPNRLEAERREILRSISK